MKISEIDSNLVVDININEPDVVWFNIKNAPFVISGITYNEEAGCYARMPLEVAGQISEKIGHLATHTAGGRVRFRTNSTFIGIHAIIRLDTAMPHMTLMGQSGFDLYRKKTGENTEIYCHSFVPPASSETLSCYASPLNIDGEMADYTINFPLYNGVKELYIALKKDAIIQEPTRYRYEKPVVYYGSSITQGGCASRPGNSYQAIISRRLDTDYINLGFTGNGRAEQAMVDYLASLDMSVFVCDYDHNAPDEEYLMATHLPLYRTVRAAQPGLPIIFVTASDSIRNQETMKRRREIIYRTYQTALNEGDQKVYFVNGREFFTGDAWDSCTVDGLHPNDLGFFRMAMRIEKELKPLLELDEG